MSNFFKDLFTFHKQPEYQYVPMPAPTTLQVADPHDVNAFKAALGEDSDQGHQSNEQTNPK